jgi:hypothetical protein
MTNNDQDSVQNTLKLEEIRFIDWLDESAKKMNEAITDSRRSLAGRGSPMFFPAEANNYSELN